ncbi:MAG: large subunit ribosomal protein [Patescibacteria group bacterium]|nr:large subunit ribosomal protein [Patescibacteria group bacterium]
MSRSKTGVVRRKKHQKVLSQTKGYWGSRSKLYRRANEAFLKAGEYAFNGRKQKKRDMKSLWIIRLNAALRAEGINYSQFINLTKKFGLQLDRKVLSEMAAAHPETFKLVLNKVREN